MSLAVLSSSLGPLSRRSSAAAFVPTDIAGLSLWLDAGNGVLDAGGATPDNNEAVATWNSQVAGPTFTQSTSARRPLYIASATNGKPAVQFVTASAQYMAGASWSMTNSAKTFFFAVNPTANSATWRAILDSMTASAQRVAIYTTEAAGKVDVFDGSTNYAPAECTTGWQVLTLVLAAGTNATHFYRNGSELGTGGTQAMKAIGGTGSTVRLGSQFNNDVPLHAQIGDVLAYGSALSADDQGKVVTYLKSKYGIA